MSPHRSLLRRWPLVMPLALVLAVPATSAAVGPDLADSAAVGDPGTVVTLVTGDQVLVEQTLDGRVEANVVPAPRDGYEPSFESIDAGADLYVVPSDATELIPDVLDLELFNVTKLAEYGYTNGTPVIITYDQTLGVRQAMPGAAVTTALPSIDAVAATITPDGSWWDATPATGDVSTFSTDAFAGVEKLWLDELTEVALDESVPLVGAPDAWDAGYDGAGLTVAVLDTGIDADHPDLDGKVVAEANFSSSNTANDVNGHGTHVAGIVAGTGAASGGQYVGVAPGAKLLNGKVLGDSGSGPISDVIDGMQWAAGNGADVINMSLGTSTASDGTDLVSQAVNTLTAQHDVLFVIAAGNSGPGGTTVASPGAADAALTVGSVTKAEQLATTSSRGPRLGDFAIKPDITAPGVNIVAARADGSTLGPIVAERYMQLSGTSMAAPHVAGAAAILSQADPDLTPAELKAALATTAVPDAALSVYEQGGGRLDVPSALTTPVLATPAPLDLGYFPFPHDDAQPETRELTYTNRTDEELTLTLSVEVTDEDGNAPADGMLSLGADTVTVPAGGASTVQVTVDVSRGEFGLYGGLLLAEHAGEVVARTPVGFFKEGERFDLSVRAIDTEGDPAAGGLTVMNVEDQSVFFQLTVNYDAAGEARLRVPPGTYAVYGFADTHPEGEPFATVRTAVAEPELEVTGDTEVLFDARTANPINVETPAHNVEPRIRTGLTLFRRPAIGPGASRGVQAFAEGTTFQAAPTEETSIGFFEFVNRWQLADPDDPIGTPVLYDVVFPETGSIPERLDYVAEPGDLGISHQEFYNHLPSNPAQEVRHSWRPWQTSSLGIFEPVAAPGLRTDYLAAADTTWTRSLDIGPRLNAPRMEYQPGEEETRTWFKQPVKPGLIEGSPWHPTFPQFREGDILDVFLPELSDSQRAHWGFGPAEFRLYEDGELIGESSRISGQYPLSSESSRIRMEADVARNQTSWRYSTRTSTAWEFDSERPAPFEARTVTPEVIDLDLTYFDGSPVLDELLEAPVVFADVGHVDDFDDIDADGAIVFMRRGELSFNQKARHAADAGAAAAVIFNNVPGSFTSNADARIPTFSLSMEQGVAVVDLLGAGAVAIEITAGGRESVPLLLVDYDIDVDLLNVAPYPRDRQGPPTVDLQVRHQPGFGGLPVPDRPAIAGARLWVSYDDGRNWLQRPVLDVGDGRFQAILDNRDPEETNGYVALRVEAWDVDGNRIEQEIIRAYGLSPR